MSKSLRHDLTVQMVKVEDLVPWERNPRQNDAAAERLAYTIQEQGWTTPILVQRESGRIIGGHTRLKAAMKIGLTEVPVIHLDVEDRQADAIAIADNRLGEIAEWDAASLAELLQELDDGGMDLVSIGYEDHELAALVDALNMATDDEWDDALGGLPDEDRAPIRQMTFTVHDDQHAEIERALTHAKSLGDFVDTGNENSNGNALARVCEMFLGSF